MEVCLSLQWQQKESRYHFRHFMFKQLKQNKTMKMGNHSHPDIIINELYF